MARLTKLEREAIVEVLEERIAAGTEDLADALGLEDDEAEKMMQRLQSARTKLKGP